MNNYVDEHEDLRDASSVMDRLLSPGLADPYPLYEWLRTNAPVYFSEQLGAHVLTRFADCEYLLKNPTLFPAPDEDALIGMMPEGNRVDPFLMLVRSLVNSNPPKHTRLRQLVSKAFTARRVEALTQDVMRIAADHVGAVAERSAGRPIDLHDELSVPVPLRVLAQLLGLPLDDDRLLAELIPPIMNVIDPSADAAAIKAADDAFARLTGHLWELVERRRANPRDDLVSALAAIQAEDRSQLSDDELQAMLVALLTAGYETTATAIDISVLTLLRHPEYRPDLKTYEGAMRFTDEVLRWDPSGPMSAGFRIAAEDVRFGDHKVPAGSQVRVLFAAANRDPAANADPDRFDPHRPSPRSLAFGGGIHHCLGRNLARMEITAVLMAVAERMPTLELVGEPVRRRSLPLRDFSFLQARLR
ncbi:cytochrome P450 [Gandjariella thermophila]|uniref:Cytochrome P450 BJ-3 n=1 Tax=Gandjariella thermophila TaxID=1931992 RepID=A0A4D4JCC1_9PSEU|nr:cytochrome P450 [Gandjariella thermophila]GDY32019.1 cytochrome P450 BJ-3 [Gandjariella thermophila]